MRQVGLSIHAHSISDNERLGSFALRVLKVVWIYNDKNFFLQKMQQAKVDMTGITKPRHLIQQTIGTELIYEIYWTGGTELIYEIYWTGYFCYVI